MIPQRGVPASMGPINSQLQAEAEPLCEAGLDVQTGAAARHGSYLLPLNWPEQEHLSSLGSTVLFG